MQHVHENILGMRFRISPEAFFQTNSLATELLYRQVRDLCNYGNPSDAIETTSKEEQKSTIYGMDGIIAGL